MSRGTRIVSAVGVALVLIAPSAAAQVVPGVPKIEIPAPAGGVWDPFDPPSYAPLDLTAPPKAGGPHPRLLFTAGDIPALKQRIAVAGSVPARAFQAMKDHVDDLREPGDPLGDRMDRVWGRQDVADTALVWLLTGDREYLDKAKRLMNLQIATVPNYGASEVFDATEYYNTRAHILQGLALAWDWLYNDLTEVERAMLLSALATLGSEHFAHSLSAWWGTISTGSNFTGNNGAAVGIAGLATWGELPHAPLWVARGRQLVSSYFGEGFDDTGAGYEGVLYGNYGLRIPTYFSAALELAGADNPLHHPKIRRQPRWVAYEVLPGGGALNPLNDARYYDLNPTHMLWASKNGADPNLAGWIWKSVADRVAPAGWVAEPVAAMLWFEEPDPNFSPEQMLPLSQAFRGRGLVHARSGWDAGDLMTSFESRHNDWGEGVHHNQDVNSFTLYSHGARLVVDSGYANYIERLVLDRDPDGARSSETEGHNYIEADGRSQDFYGKGRLHTAVSGDWIDVAGGDARSAYMTLQPDEANRWFVHQRSPDGGPGYLVLADRFRQGLGDHEYHSYLHTEPGNTIAISPPAAPTHGDAVFAAPNGARLAVTVRGAAPLTVSQDTFTSDYPDIGKHARLVVSTQGAEHIALTTLDPFAPGAGAAHAKDVAAVNGIALRHGADDILFRTKPGTTSTQKLATDGTLAIERGRDRFALIDGTLLRRNGKVLAEVGGPATVVAGPREVALHGSGIGRFRVWGPDVDTVTVNGNPVAFARCNGYVVSPPSC